jgi:tetratricopeptide (TPR) repeat protein
MRTPQLLCALALCCSAGLAGDDCLPWRDGPKPRGAEAEEEARSDLRKAARDFPSDFREHLRLGQMLFEGKCYALALSELLRARTLGERGFEVFARLASLENILGAFGDAAVDADAAAQAASSPQQRASATALAGLAVEALGQDDAAIARFRQSLQLEGRQESSSLELAKVLERKGLYAEAATVLEKHVAQFPASAEGWAELAATQTALHNPERAVDCWGRVSRLKPDYAMVESRQIQAMLAEQQPDMHAVLRAVEKAKTRTPQDTDLFYFEGKAWLGLGSTTEAAKALENAVRLRPLEAAYHYRLGLTYRKLGRLQLAQKEFDMVKRLRDAGSSP